MTHTDDQLREIERYCERATAGDWYVNEVRATPHNRHEVRCRSAAYGSIGRLIADLRFPSGTAENACLIAQARTDLPAVVRELLEARKVLADLVRTLDYVHSDDDFRAVWTIAQLHRGRYQGPRYEEELDAARAFLGGDHAGEGETDG